MCDWIPANRFAFVTRMVLASETATEQLPDASATKAGQVMLV